MRESHQMDSHQMDLYQMVIGAIGEGLNEANARIFAKANGEVLIEAQFGEGFDRAKATERSNRLKVLNLR